MTPPDDEPKKTQINEVRLVPGGWHTHILLCPRCRKKFKALRAEGPAYDAWRAERDLPPLDPAPLCTKCRAQKAIDEDGYRWVRDDKGHWWLEPLEHPGNATGLDHFPEEHER